MTLTSQEHSKYQVYNRIVRSFDNVKRAKGSERSPLTPATTLVDEETHSSTEDQVQRADSTSSTSKKQKIGYRLRKLGYNFKKGRRNGEKSGLASPRITINDTPFPTTDPELVSTVASSPTITSDVHVHERLLSIVSELQEANDAEEVHGRTVSEDEAQSPEPMTFAKRIQGLVDMLPFPSPGQSSPGPSMNEDPDGRAIPPQDSRLIRFLSSPTIMNGSTMKDKPSIWSILERMGAPHHVQNPSNDPSSVEDTESMFTDNSSVMVYSPLIPSIEDHVELAELVPMEEDEVQDIVPEKPDVIANTSWTSMWPLSSLWFTTSQTPAAQPQPRNSVETVSVYSSPRSTNLGLLPPEGKIEAPRAWVPSETKLSVQAMWWGYRLYLPPPILEILDDQTLEATKRAAMITTALAWFANNLPVSALPPALRPGVLLLQRLVPYLGYIGSFISWSWSTIKTYDVGYGVTLTATWLLPIALIPGTWHENDFPKSPGPQKNIQLPSLTYHTPSTPHTATSLLSPTSSTPLSLASPSTSTSLPLSPSQFASTPTWTPTYIDSTPIAYTQTPVNHTPTPSNPWTTPSLPSSDYVSSAISNVIASPASPRSPSWNPWRSPPPRSRRSEKTPMPSTPAPFQPSPAMIVTPLTNLTTPTTKLTSIPSPTSHSHSQLHSPSNASTVFYTPQSVTRSVSVPPTPIPAMYAQLNLSPIVSSPPSSSFKVSNPNSVYVPIASPPPTDDDMMTPVPPIPSPPVVPLGSPLMAQLLHGPLIGVVPLPDDDPEPIMPERDTKKTSTKNQLFR